ncbi:hypothetical protein G7068_11780 [Leucobacter viscericola]|uniref:Uncharacterized protein n=1 Tax=Leucobacter viscericola TaxID=2714935 RepID=A0A6G7XHE0_9MICO|nr:hypothetical protein [Leucobacter viscericola]QIK63788.1 hypothetical protein G7068_11780 [Leucobacter viscericola]
MNTTRKNAVPAVIGLLPWIPLAGLFLVAPTLLIFGLRGLSGTATFVCIVWLVIWAIRTGGRWVRMMKLAAAGTPPDMLPAGAAMLDAWPVLIDVCGWVPRTALGQKPPLAMKLWGLISGNSSDLGPQIRRIENAPAGPVAIVALTPRVTAEHIAAHAERIANMWGAESVEVSRTRPGEVAILARIRDPLEGNRSGFTNQQPTPPSVSAQDFLSGTDNEKRL